MKKQRYLPFGYQMQEGQITIHPKESKLVSNIFISYMNGDTLQSIANQLQLRGFRIVRQAEFGLSIWYEEF